MAEEEIFSDAWIERIASVYEGADEDLSMEEILDQDDCDAIQAMTVVVLSGNDEVQDVFKKLIKAVPALLKEEPIAAVETSLRTKKLREAVIEPEDIVTDPSVSGDGVTTMGGSVQSALEEALGVKPGALAGTKITQVGPGGMTIDPFGSDQLKSNITQEELNTSLIIDRDVVIGDDITSLGTVKCFTGNVEIFSAPLADLGQLEYVRGLLQLYETTINGIEKVKYVGRLILDSQFKFTLEEVLAEKKKFENMSEIESLNYIGQNYPKVFKDILEKKRGY